MIIYLDTETTGLRPGQICQLSYVIQDGQQVRGKNFFYTVDAVEYGAFMVHGFSVEKLKSLSKGKRFSDSILEVKEDFEPYFDNLKNRNKKYGIFIFDTRDRNGPRNSEHSHFPE